jgi:transposase
MTRQRRVFTAALKAKVALPAVRGDLTTAQLASKFAVYSSQVTSWKKQLLEQVASLFEDRRRRDSEASIDEEELFAQIGRLKVEVEWLKKKAAQLD